MTTDSTANSTAGDGRGLAYVDVIGLASIGSRLYDRILPVSEPEPGSIADAERSVWARIFWPIWQQLDAEDREYVQREVTDPCCWTGEERCDGCCNRDWIEQAIADAERRETVRAA